MNERRRQTEFLTSLMRFGENEPCLDLQERLQKAQAEEKLVSRKIFTLLVLAALSALGLGYTAVFLPEAFQRSGSSLIKLFSTLGLASVLSLAVCSCWWCWHRMLVNGLQEEGRHLVKSLIKTQIGSERSGDGSMPASANRAAENSHTPAMPITISVLHEVQEEEQQTRLAA